jgi:iron complex outermembrane receptor protein
MGGRLFASLDVYEQERSFYSRPATGVATVSAIRTDGVEGELRWLVTKRLGITGTATWQRTKKLATAGNGTFITMPGCLTNAGCTNTWAGYTFGYTNMLGWPMATTSAPRPTFRAACLPPMTTRASGA